MEHTDQLDASNRRLPESRVRRFAKRNAASRPSSILPVSHSLSSTSQIDRVDWVLALETLLFARTSGRRIRNADGLPERCQAAKRHASRSREARAARGWRGVDATGDTALDMRLALLLLFVCLGVERSIAGSAVQSIPGWHLPAPLEATPPQWPDARPSLPFDLQVVSVIDIAPSGSVSRVEVLAVEPVSRAVRAPLGPELKESVSNVVERTVRGWRFEASNSASQLRVTATLHGTPFLALARGRLCTSMLCSRRARSQRRARCSCARRSVHLDASRRRSRSAVPRICVSRPSARSAVAVRPPSQRRHNDWDRHVRSVAPSQVRARRIGVLG